MTILYWNVRGAGNPAFVRNARDLIDRFNPSIVVFFETRVGQQRAETIIRQIERGFNNWHTIEPIGYSGGIWILWRNNMVNLSILSSTSQETHAMIRTLPSSSPWIFTAIYASPKFRNRRILWDNLQTVAANHDLPWLIVGDFNKKLTSSDKRGGNPISLHRATMFKECLDTCSMIDLGFSGPKVTWSNLKNPTHLIQARIDKAFANPS
ncbi:hypothetical protein SLA2020_201450 [Shorea laevis]